MYDIVWNFILQILTNSHYIKKTHNNENFMTLTTHVKSIFKYTKVIFIYFPLCVGNRKLLVEILIAGIDF